MVGVWIVAAGLLRSRRGEVVGNRVDAFMSVLRDILKAPGVFVMSQQ